jgi:hypothetical protein
MADIFNLGPHADTEGEVHAPAYGYVRDRGLRAAGMSFWRRDGSSFGFPYARLARAALTPAAISGDGVDVLRLVFATREEILLRGCHLEALVDLICQQRLLRVTEQDEGQEPSSRNGAAVVCSIACTLDANEPG